MNNTHIQDINQPSKQKYSKPNLQKTSKVTKQKTNLLITHVIHFIFAKRKQLLKQNSMDITKIINDERSSKFWEHT